MYTFCVNGLTRFVISSYPPGIPLWMRPFRSYSIFLVFLLVYLCLCLFSFLTFFLLFFSSCLYRSENTWHETSLRWPQLEMFTKALSIAIKNRSLFAFGLNDPGITKVLSFFFSFPTSVHLWLLLSTRFVSRYLVNANQISTVSKARCIFHSNCRRNRHRLSNFFSLFLDFSTITFWFRQAWNSVKILINESVFEVYGWKHRKSIFVHSRIFMSLCDRKHYEPFECDIVEKWNYFFVQRYNPKI